MWGDLADVGRHPGTGGYPDPTGTSHPPAENAERDDCLTGVEALTAVAAELAGPEPTP